MLLATGELVELHEKLTLATGGSSGIRSIGLLDTAAPVRADAMRIGMPRASPRRSGSASLQRNQRPSVPDSLLLVVYNASMGKALPRNATAGLAALACAAASRGGGKGMGRFGRAAPLASRSARSAAALFAALLAACALLALPGCPRPSQPPGAAEFRYGLDEPLARDGLPALREPLEECDLEKCAEGADAPLVDAPSAEDPGAALPADWGLAPRPAPDGAAFDPALPPAAPPLPGADLDAAHGAVPPAAIPAAPPPLALAPAPEEEALPAYAGAIDGLDCAGLFCQIFYEKGFDAGAGGAGAVMDGDGNALFYSDSLGEMLDWLRGNAQSGSRYIVEINSDASIARQALAFPEKSGVGIVLRGGGERRVVSLSGAGSLFMIGAGASLTLGGGITLEGISENSMPLALVQDGGTLAMDAGAVIAGNSASVSGAGVRVGRGGTLLMSEGSAIAGNASADSGGGVHVDQGGTFLMGGGIIFGLNAPDYANAGRNAALSLGGAEAVAKYGSPERGIPWALLPPSSSTVHVEGGVLQGVITLTIEMIPPDYADWSGRIDLSDAAIGWGPGEGGVRVAGASAAASFWFVEPMAYYIYLRLDCRDNESRVVYRSAFPSQLGVGRNAMPWRAFGLEERIEAIAIAVTGMPDGYIGWSGNILLGAADAGANGGAVGAGLDSGWARIAGASPVFSVWACAGLYDVHLRLDCYLGSARADYRILAKNLAAGRNEIPWSYFAFAPPAGGGFAVSFVPDIGPYIIGRTISVIGPPPYADSIDIAVLNPWQYDSIRWFFGGAEITWDDMVSGASAETLTFDSRLHENLMGMHFVTLVVSVGGASHSKSITFRVVP